MWDLTKNTKDLYETMCMACHDMDGTGAPLESCRFSWY
ncbi:MAG: cytochrome c [Deltaproteobacteria bacterium]|nr:cytochrome c [Deltaproteobacteria bacterium]